MNSNGTVGIVDWGAGNIENVAKALRKVGASCAILPVGPQLERCDRLVLPGVGSFADAMHSIGEGREVLRRLMQTRPTLGICLGMQILATRGYEGGETFGLDALEGEVCPMRVHAKVPHMGWGQVRRTAESPLFAGIDPALPFYFMHSFEFVNYTDILGLTSYHSHLFVSAVHKGTVHGVQFHPEKSGEQGLEVLRNFLKLEA